MAASDVGLAALGSTILGADLAKQAICTASGPAIAAIEAASRIAVVAATIAGAVKQYEMLGKQGDLFEAQKEVTLRNIALAERTFNETLMPSYKLSMDYFEKNFRKQWEPILTKVVACGTKECEYVPDYERHTTRVLADVAKVIAGAKRTARRALDCYSVGTCFDQDYRFAELQARMVVDSKNMGRAYEEDFKLKKDTFYWNRLTTCATIAQNIGSLASNLMQYGKGSLISGLQTITQAGNGFDAAVASGFSTLANEGKFYGGLGASLQGIFNGRDANADGRALLSQSATRGLPSGAQLYTSQYQRGEDYTAGVVSYDIANTNTVNKSGLQTTSSGLGIRVDGE
jgi:hypothetical protein